MDSAASLSLPSFSSISISSWTVRSRGSRSTKYRRPVNLRATQAHAHTEAMPRHGQMEAERKKVGNSTLYDVLGLGRGACAEDIKKAYRKLALRFHPDGAAAAGDEKERRTVMFKQIRNAYAILSDSSSRAQYDREILCTPVCFSTLRGTGRDRPQPVYKTNGRSWETDQCW